MKRLRHPIGAIREPFGTAGLIVAMVALVAALGGTALAAKGALTGKQKKEVEKIAKKSVKAGPEGKQGPAGTNGTNGTNGKDGTNGLPGDPGKDGKSVVTVGNATAGECPSGGKVYEVEGSGVKNKVCNGTTGYTETLPPGKTETGTWAAQGTGKKITTEVEGTKEEVNVGTNEVFVPISFTIPVEGAEAITQIHFIESGDPPPAGCEGGSVNEPIAEPGNLCIYNGEASQGIEAALVGRASSSFGGSVGGPGAMMLIVFEGTGNNASGSWAVTAPE